MSARGRKRAAAYGDAGGGLALALPAKRGEISTFYRGATESCNLGAEPSRCAFSRGGHIISNKARTSRGTDAVEHLKDHKGFRHNRLIPKANLVDYSIALASYRL